MIYLSLNNLELKTFTEQDALDYCQISNLNPDNITELNLSDNKLTNISGINLFKNLKRLELQINKIKDISVLKDLNNLKVLSLGGNKIKDISVIQYLNNLETFFIQFLELESDQIQYINSLKNLRNLWCYNGFKDMSVLDKLNKNIFYKE